MERGTLEIAITAAYSLLKDAVYSNGPRIQSMGQSWTHPARMPWDNSTNSSVPSIRNSYSDDLEGDVSTLYLYILKDPWVILTHSQGLEGTPM